MTQENYITKLVQVSEQQISHVLTLVAEGATVPFMARYRKERTGGLDEVQIQKIIDANEQFVQIEKRKESILNSIKEQGQLSKDLKDKIVACFNLNELEDLYLPYKKKRKTKADTARENGLEGLAKMIMSQNNGDVVSMASRFVKGNVDSEEEALEGARYIIAEWINENSWLRNRLRKQYQYGAIVHSKLVKGKEDEAEKYQDYFKFEEKAFKIASYRLLAVLRGEQEKLLKVKIEPDKEEMLQLIAEKYVKGNNNSSSQIELAIKDAYKRLIQPSLETELRNEMKEKADEESIKIFGANLRQLLMQNPLGGKKILAIDPGFRTGCKVVCLDENGNLKNNATIYPHAPQKKVSESKKKVSTLVEQYKIDAIAIGNGTASRETEFFIKGIRFNRKVSVYVVNEAGASIYSASKVGREEFPEYDVTVRGSVSIGRRLMDPLSELVKIEPKSIGVGQYQHDVNQKLLEKRLDEVTVSCVNQVGINLNTSSKYILKYISGIGEKVAQNIIDYRKENGNFSSRKELKKVPGLGNKAFEQAAGFLRVKDGVEALDETAIHPENYPLAKQILKDQLIKNINEVTADSFKKLDKSKYVSSNAGLETISDIVKELKKPNSDPRKLTRVVEFSDKIKTIQDLEEGMTLDGIVNNITAFGAFIDLGIKENGLVHKSNISDAFVEHPVEVLKLHQVVKVKLLEVDVVRKRIGLTMKGIEQPKNYN